MSDCKQCGLSVRWENQKGQWQCLNPDGSIHWDLCSQKRFDQIRKTGQSFTGKNIYDDDGVVIAVADGFKTKLKRSGYQLTHIESKRVSGKKNLKLDGCDQCVPPWERCERCPITIQGRRL